MNNSIKVFGNTIKTILEDKPLS